MNIRSQHIMIRELFDAYCDLHNSIRTVCTISKQSLTPDTIREPNQVLGVHKAHTCSTMYYKKAPFC